MLKIWEPFGTFLHFRGMILGQQFQSFTPFCLGKCVSLDLEKKFGVFCRIFPTVLRETQSKKCPMCESWEKTLILPDLLGRSLGTLRSERKLLHFGEAFLPLIKLAKFHNGLVSIRPSSQTALLTAVKAMPLWGFLGRVFLWKVF